MTLKYHKIIDFLKGFFGTLLVIMSLFVVAGIILATATFINQYIPIHPLAIGTILTVCLVVGVVNAGGK